jgi:hypothetical protein
MINMITDKQAQSLIWRGARIIGATKYKILSDHYIQDISDRIMAEARRPQVNQSTMQRRRENILVEFQVIIEFLIQKSPEYYLGEAEG